jgi:hypothetical protein
MASEGWRTVEGRRCGERGGDLLADVERLADAGDQQLAAAGQGVLQRLDGLVERPVEAFAGALEGGDLDVEDRLSLVQMGGGTHGGRLAEG